MSDILYGGAHWIGPAYAENFMVGRSGYAVVDIVIHHTAGTLQAAINRFQSSSGQSQPNPSAHFIIDRDGTRYQMVDTADMAYHSADYFENLVSIGIEHVRIWDTGPGSPGYQPITDAQYQSSHELCTILAADNGFPLTADHVWPHNHFYNTTCPGDMELARVIQGGFSVTDSEAIQQIATQLGTNTSNVQARISSIWTKLGELETLIKAIPATGGGTEPIEPTKVTLHVPAQDISGTLT